MRVLCWIGWHRWTVWVCELGESYLRAGDYEGDKVLTFNYRRICVRCHEAQERKG